jgi:hypothetical protein
MKVVINRCWGGFSISREAAEYMAIRGHKEAQEILDEFRKTGRWYGYVCDSDKERSNPLLVEAVEVLGDKADGDLARLTIVEIPDGVDYYIDDYDGKESVHERHRSWS